jgi:uncharacterized protein involved in type VI secretion and phage assembly
MDHIQAGQSLAGSGHASHEAHDMSAFRPSAQHGLHKVLRGFREVLGCRVCMADLTDAVARKHHFGSLDDRRNWTIGRVIPHLTADGQAADFVTDAEDGRGEIFCTHTHRVNLQFG